MPARFATFIEVLRDPAVNVDTFAHVEQRAISIEKTPLQRGSTSSGLPACEKVMCCAVSVIVPWSLKRFAGASTVRILSSLIELDRQVGKPQKKSNRSFC